MTQDKDWWLARWTFKPLSASNLFWWFIFTVPLLAGALGRFFKGRPFYTGIDYQSITCAGRKYADGLTMYPPPEAFGCEGLAVDSSYIYLPWVARVFNYAETALGPSLFFELYTFVLFSGLALTLWVVFFSDFKFATRVERWAFMGLLTGGLLVHGNIAIIVYAILALAAKFAARIPVIMLAVVLFAGAIKQVWLVYLLFFLLLDRSIVERLAWFIAGAILGLLPTLLFYINSAEQIDGWLTAVTYYGTAKSPGQGFLGWLDFVGRDAGAAYIAPLWMAFAGMMTVSALAIAEHNKLDAQARCWLALAVATLISPRLTAYDFMLLAPGMVLAARIGVKQGRIWLRSLMFGVLGLTILLNFLDQSPIANLPSTLGCSIVILALGMMSRDGLLALSFWWRVAKLDSNNTN